MLVSAYLHYLMAKRALRSAGRPFSEHRKLIALIDKIMPFDSLVLKRDKASSPAPF
jgi:hypothetical protein